MYIIVDDAARVRVTYASHAPAEAVEVAEPEGWEPERQHDWRLEDGALVHDPLPEASPIPTDAERLAALEAAMLETILGGGVDG